jgi:hypothetical protein
MNTRRAHTGLRGNDGSVLLGALILIFIVSAGAGLVWRALQQQVDRQHRESRQEQVQQLAEAGVDTAIAALRHDRNYAGEQDTPLGEGLFTVGVVRETGDAYAITSEAKLRDGAIVRAESTLLATVRLDGAGHIASLLWRKKEH